MDIEIREYRDEDAEEWLRVHAVILTLSHAWNYSIQERPAYKRPNTRLVAVEDGKIVGLTDAEYDTAPGEICFLGDSRGGYVLEFGRLPEYGGLHIGEKLMEATKKDALRKGVHRLEYWTQDRAAQEYYRHLKMQEIGRHYRFRMRAPKHLGSVLDPKHIGVEYIYACCMPKDWPRIKKQYDIIETHPLEPHLCIGYEVRF
jgi:ribosomal protein S18 acetylase RimI-like enzyme